MQFVTLIPICRNNGEAVDQAELDAIIRKLWVTFGGCSIDGPVEGHWVDSQTGVHYQDACLRATVVCDNNRLTEAETAVIEIGRQLAQEAMFFEVRDFDGVRFLRTK